MAKRSVLIVDDELGVRESLRMILKDSYETVELASGEEALEFLNHTKPGVVLLDILMPGLDGIEVLEKMKELHPAVPVIMLTATKTVKTAVEAMKLGAYDYITKPFDTDELQLHIARACEDAAIREENAALRQEVEQQYGLGNIKGKSPKMRAIFKTISMVAPLKTTVLITGESGTGKELVAKAIHFSSSRVGKPFVVINCAAIPETLLESELFGHERGSFTDAHARKLGQFELADQGTIFLDEIAEMHPSVQAKLLRVIEQGELMRVGGKSQIRVDVRIIAATNRDLESGLRDGSFRPDLFYRLNVVAIYLPPLRERRDDLPLLMKHFIDLKREQLAVESRSFSTEAVEALLRYDWPGNVRELENIVERMLVLAEDNPVGIDSLPEHVRAPATQSQNIRERVLRGEKSLTDAVDEFERDIIGAALTHVEFNQTRAADLLGTTRRILKYRMDKLGISGEAK